MGIIGVVAALTIPTIIQNSNNRKFASQFKKTMSGLSQAAIMSQAQYDSDYSSLNTASDSCDSESLAKSNLTMCGLLNSTLSGHTFLGMYGTVKGANANGIYTIATAALPAGALNSTNTMIFALADGSYVGFNKDATRCGVTPGTPMSNTILGEGGALANCVGFIDVNGPNPPNKEVTCKNAQDTALNPGATCAPASAIGDVFPIVFHDGIVEPASNAGRAILSAGKGAVANSTTGQESDETIGENSDETISDDNTAGSGRRTLIIDGIEYVFINGKWYHNVSGNYYSANYDKYTPTSDGYYERTAAGLTYRYDSEMNELGLTKDGVWYDKKDLMYVRDDGNGNFITMNGVSLTKTSSGYERADSPYTYRYDNDLNLLGMTYSGSYYTYYKDANVFARSKGNYRYDRLGNKYTRLSDGSGYEKTEYSRTYRYDTNMNAIGLTYNGKWYDKKGNTSTYVRDDGNGNLVTYDNRTYTLRDDGLYEYMGWIYDENLIQIK